MQILLFFICATETLMINKIRFSKQILVILGSLESPHREESESGKESGLFNPILHFFLKKKQGIGYDV